MSISTGSVEPLLKGKRMAKKVKHIGFKAAEAAAARGGARNPAAAVAAGAQKASASAKARNPRLKKVAAKGTQKSRHGYFI